MSLQTIYKISHNIITSHSFVGETSHSFVGKLWRIWTTDGNKSAEHVHNILALTHSGAPWWSRQGSELNSPGPKRLNLSSYGMWQTRLQLIFCRCSSSELFGGGERPAWSQGELGKDQYEQSQRFSGGTTLFQTQMLLTEVIQIIRQHWKT